MDWQTGLLYGVGIIATLVVASLSVWGSFHLYSYCYDKDKDLEEDEEGVKRNKTAEKSKRPDANGGQKDEKLIENLKAGEKAVAVGKQTMLSTLHQSVTDNDVVLATALSAIPLKQLGGAHSDIIVDVGQQMYLNRGQLGEREELECIVCRKRKEVTWEKPHNMKSTSKSGRYVAEVLKMFEVNDEALRSIKQDITKEFELGLVDEENATIKMLITYVRELSRGDENGLYLALDLGGTHFRVLSVQLNTGANPKVICSVHTIPSELLVVENGQELFDFIALKLLEFVKQHKLRQRRISLGFTFSFPCKQYGLTQSVLVKWCKGFRVGGVVGTDVVKQLKNALKRQLSGLVEAYIDVVAVINDTTGTLVACASSHKDCRIGLIVGTGFNVCYMEKLSRCEKWPANYTNPKQVIINCEWGAMGDNKEKRELDKYRNEFDGLIDAQSVNPRNQTYEKMVSGMYLGEMLRLAMLKLYQRKALFPKMSAESAAESQARTALKLAEQPASPKSATSVGSTASHDQEGHKLYMKDVLNGRHLSMLAKDEMAGTFEQSSAMMVELNIKSFSEQDLAIVVQLASHIIRRSARLVACGISALLERMKRPFCVIGYDGSVIKHHPYFLKLLIEKCQQMTPEEYKFEFVESSDGSGLGAAVVAAALHKERRPLYVVKPGKLYEMHFMRNQSASTTQQQ